MLITAAHASLADLPPGYYLGAGEVFFLSEHFKLTYDGRFFIKKRKAKCFLQKSSSLIVTSTSILCQSLPSRVTVENQKITSVKIRL